MSVGYRVFGFCNDCMEDMPDTIRHSDLSSSTIRGLQRNLREIASKKGWTRSDENDYCPACSRGREEDRR